VFVLSLVSALWLVVAVYFLGNISAHFNPATTLAFALRRDMDWTMAAVYWVVQFAAAIAGSFLARGLFGNYGNLAATMPQAGHELSAAGFEAIITFALVLMVLGGDPGWVGDALRLRSLIDPGAEVLDLLVWPAPIAGHASGGQPLVDRLRVRAYVLVGGEVEGERHRLDVAVAKERADVLRVRHFLFH
jgi:glycerol uptake facilitator-like aquaporin